MAAKKKAGAKKAAAKKKAPAKKAAARRPPRRRLPRRRPGEEGREARPECRLHEGNDPQRAARRGRWPNSHPSTEDEELWPISRRTDCDAKNRRMINAMTAEAHLRRKAPGLHVRMTRW